MLLQATSFDRSILSFAFFLHIHNYLPCSFFHLLHEIIDVLEYPQRALADGVLVTPSLTKVSPSPSAKIVGNLSDTGSVLHALGIA